MSRESIKSDSVASLDATCLYGRYDLHVEFAPSMNVFYGINGSGKTTLLHILANVLNGEYDRFLSFPFNSISVRLAMGRVLTVTKERTEAEYFVTVKDNDAVVAQIHESPTRDHDREAREGSEDTSWDRVMARRREYLAHREMEPNSESSVSSPPLPSAYLPAFRTMIDAWASVEAHEGRLRQRNWSERATRSARRWFGAFVPSVNYPSLLEIEDRLTDELYAARLQIGQADRRMLSRAFTDIFKSLYRSSDGYLEREGSVLDSIKSLFDRLDESPLQEDSTLLTQMYAQLRKSVLDLDVPHSEQTVRVLNVYKEVLEEVVSVQEDSFRGIQRYLESVNNFLEGKRLIVDMSTPRHRRGAVGIRFDDGSSTHQLRALSSGERQIVTLIYVVTHMSQQKVVLIDEPEISLHVDWQRNLLAKMSEQIGDRQIIACTHSPLIAADYAELQKEIRLMPTTEQLVSPRDVEIDEEDSSL